MAVLFIITTQKSNMLDEVTVVYRGIIMSVKIKL